MTGEEIRDIGFLRWRDPFAWLEKMKGFAWTSMIQKENTTFDTAVQMICSKEYLAEMKKQFKSSHDAHTLRSVFQCGDVFITPQGGLELEWHWKGDAVRSASNIFSQGEYCWSIEVDKEGKEIYMIVCYKKGAKKPIWSRTTSVGPFLAVRNGLCYVIEATGELQYRRLITVDAETGKSRKVLFEEKNLRCNLSLVQKEGGCVFMISENSGRQRLYHIDGLKVEGLCPQGVSFFPVGYGFKGEVCYFARETHFSQAWKAFGYSIKSWALSSQIRQKRILTVSIKHKLYSTLHAGKVSIYECRSALKPHLLHEYIGSLTLDPFAIQEQRDTIPVIYTKLGCHPSSDVFPKAKLVSPPPFATVSYHEANSKDTTPIPFLIVKGPRPSYGLMCIAYGAYNIPTSLSLSRWKPYLENGWSLCFAMVRGGGDCGEQWAEEARRDKKYKSIEDIECIIRAAHEIVHVSAKQTCLYGRSAGGYIVGAVCAHHRMGDLIGAAYAEVPYVDILRTTTNPSLPLTILEYDEFGNPAEKLEDLQTILRLSPVDALPSEGAPGIFVVATTSINDREVLPYESIKWVLKLRGFPEKTPGQLKLLRILDGQGHFVKGEDSFQQKAEDYILLQTYLESKKNHTIH
jgi:hypothetical protein